ncbi:hypothetical protein XELAEV_18007272mg [Xenopus laevis]|uniref:Ig-like domain-containing protein n=1 Tax=Xenopus laevis TaxID=8355 RepID=A0A974I4V0_XENLA|nr:hypothetical protein XELAEV_18007272mg [Xenopus laevis]
MMLYVSAVLYIILSGHSMADSVTQISSEETAQVGGQVAFICNYRTTSTDPYLHWYVQQPGKNPCFILLRNLYSKAENEPGGKYLSKLNKESNSVDLRISGVSVSDSGLYYCAVSATVSLSAASSVQEALVLSVVLKNVAFPSAIHNAGCK